MAARRKRRTAKRRSSVWDGVVASLGMVEPRRKPGRGSNRRVRDPGRRPKPPTDPHERKLRNRTILALGVLALVNAWVFLGRGESLPGLGSLDTAAIASGTGPLPPLAGAPDDACGNDPVRVFAGLEDLLRLDTRAGGERTLRSALLELGVADDDIDGIEAGLRTHLDLGLALGGVVPVRLALDRNGGLQALELEPSEGHVVQACRSPEGFRVRNLQHPLRSDVEVLHLELGRDADLDAAVRTAGEAPELAGILARALASEIDVLNEARPGDRMAVMIEKRWLGRRFHRYGELLALRFHGTLRRTSIFRYEPEGRDPGLFDGEGQPIARVMLRSPVAHFPVDPDARALLAPSIEVVHGHLGASYRLPEGAPIVALGDGLVRAVDRTLERGHVVDLELEDGTLVRYCHLLRFIGELAPGDRVTQGQVIGLAGHTGRTPHDRLRLELWIPSDTGMTAVDPLTPTAEGERRSPRVGEPLRDDALARFRDDTAPQRRALRVTR